MTDGYTTDAEAMMTAANDLTEAAELAEQKAATFESETFIPTSAYGGQSVPEPLSAWWNFTGRLADLVEGPYNQARLSMIATLSRTAVVLRANADELTDAAAHYLVQEALNTDTISKAED